MKKLSEAEKKRRKEDEIIRRATHIMNILWACRDSVPYNMIRTWSPDKIDEYMKMWTGFKWGVVICDGPKWDKRLNKMWVEYEALHGKLFK